MNQLCGRCRGNESDHTLPPAIEEIGNEKWVSRWQKSFQTYPYSRFELLNQCKSCIDFGFISLFDKLAKFKNSNIKLVHLKFLGEA